MTPIQKHIRIHEAFEAFKDDLEAHIDEYKAYLQALFADVSVCPEQLDYNAKSLLITHLDNVLASKAERLNRQHEVTLLLKNLGL